MLNDYMDHAMQRARYELLEDGTYFGDIPGFDGLWAAGLTQPECARELRETLEEWILLNIADHTLLPTVDGLSLEVGKPV
jgi:predicted RNase H-like HicB family nuclease